jgi:hypothetical protein
MEGDPHACTSGLGRFVFLQRMAVVSRPGGTTSVTRWRSRRSSGPGARTFWTIPGTSSELDIEIVRPWQVPSRAKRTSPGRQNTQISARRDGTQNHKSAAHNGGYVGALNMDCCHTR